MARVVVQLPKEAIDECFEQAQSQGDYMIALYRKALGHDFDNCIKINGYPIVHKETALYIARKARAWDTDYFAREYQPWERPMAGGLWLNNGFSTLDNEGVAEWTVEYEPDILVFEEEGK